MVAFSSGALRRLRGAGIRSLEKASVFDVGPSHRGPPAPVLRLPQTGLADRLLLDSLRGQGITDAASLIAAQAAHLRDGVPALDQLLARGAPAAPLLSLTAEAARTDYLDDPGDADPGLVDMLGLQTCLARNLAPLCRAGGATIIATGRPTEALRHARLIRQRLGPFRLVLAEQDRVAAAVLSVRGEAAAEAAHLSVPLSQSCRGLSGSIMLWLLAPVLLLLGVALLAGPLVVLAVLTLVAVMLLVAVSLLRGAALWAAVQASRQPQAELSLPKPSIADLPRHSQPDPFITVLVPLLREERIAERLVQRLSALDYPRERLEILLIVEARDLLTQSALRRARLPPWMRVVPVPSGPVQTKPRALNYAMAQARGSIIGVYDAEDAPEPDQLRKVARGFASARPETVCLQGALDFYNSGQSLLTRLFTLDYASWFRVILPGMARLGLVLPLGGTTLFFRRRALEALGGWDAWNVTEDADLGLRLARQGWTTELLPSTTYEEATSQMLPWVRQRSRWIKGYAMTWASHMRDPALLWRELGPRRFFGLQVMFLSPVLQPLLAPLLWSFWALAFGLSHPLVPLLGQVGVWMLVAVFLAAEALNLATCLIALRGTRHRGLGLIVPLMQIYGWLATFAAWKAVFELVRSPFYWDKTTHGHSRQSQSASIRLASTRSLVS